MRKSSFKKALGKAMRDAVKDAVLTALDTEEVGEVISDLAREAMEGESCFLVFEEGVPQVLIGPAVYDATVQSKLNVDLIKAVTEDVEDEDIGSALEAMDLLILKLSEARTALEKRRNK